MSTEKQETIVTTKGTEAEGQGRTFTQEDLDRIVGDRIARERAKFEDYDTLKAKAAKFDEAEEASKSELQKATEKVEHLQAKLDSYEKAEKLRRIHEEVAKETGVPAHLLTGETKEDCEAQAKAIMSFAKPEAFPEVKDGGEVRNTGEQKTRDIFADAISGAI